MTPIAHLIAPGVLFSPSRAAASEKESSSSVKCSEIVMGCPVDQDYGAGCADNTSTIITSPRQVFWPRFCQSTLPSRGAVPVVPSVVQ